MMNEARRRPAPTSKAGDELSQSNSSGNRGASFSSITKRPVSARLRRRNPSLWWILIVTVVLLSCVLYVGLSSLRRKQQPSSSSSSSAQLLLIRPDSSKNQQGEEVVDWRDEGKVLAMLYPPGLMGGYRNQVIRFLAFCVYAIRHDIPYLLLPSLMWVTQVLVDDFHNGTLKEVWVPIPFDLLFDVNHFNSFPQHLPQLIDYDPTFEGYDCWTTLDPTQLDTIQRHHNTTLLTQQVLSRGVLTPIANRSIAITTRQEIINPRWVDFSPDTQHCQRPVVYGGGKGSGKLWQDSMALQGNKDSIPQQADAYLLQALQPKQEWRDLAMSCVNQHVTTTTTTSHHNYVALHARIELEMMNHRCGKNMEKNLTKILGMVQDMIVQEEQEDEPLLQHEKIGGIFVAVSRSGIELNEGKWYERFKRFADENLATLNRVVGHDGWNGLSVFECGQPLLDRYYASHPGSIDYGSLLQSMINFYVATESTAFVGVSGSSYSTDVWTTRYHQGKGHLNFEYTADRGVVRIPNGGLPPPHKNCGKKTKR